MQERIEELRSILQGLDELTELWGDEAKFRRMRDRLRAVINADQQRGVDDKSTADYIANNCMCGDTENDHAAADEVLCEILEKLGYPRAVAAWRKVAKWYA